MLVEVMKLSLRFVPHVGEGGDFDDALVHVAEEPLRDRRS